MSGAKKPPRVLHHIVCDDIRLELGNKVTLVGCYGNKIFVTPGFPGIMPKLCFFFRIGNVAHKTSYRLEVTSPKTPSHKSAVVASREGTLTVRDAGEIAQLAVVSSPFRLPSPGKYGGKLKLGERRAYTFAFDVIVRKNLPGLPTPDQPEGKEPGRGKKRRSTR